MNLNDTFTLYVLIVFVVILLSEFWNVSRRVKKILGLSQIKEVKMLDCLPCFSFWISSITFNPLVMMGTFITFYLIDKIVYNDK